MKRHKIIAFIGQEEKYVPEEINEILDNLSFRQLSTSQLPDWELYTRRNENNEFAAIYNDRKKKDKKFLVEGTYSNIKTPQRDLENISKYFNRSKLKRMAESKAYLGIGGLLTGFTGAYCFLDGFSDEVAIRIGLLMEVGGGILGGVTAATLENILNRYYGSKLSKESENYNYGSIAEKKLTEESIFERIKSGDLTKQNYLKLRENFTDIYF